MSHLFGIPSSNEDVKVRALKRFAEGERGMFLRTWSIVGMLHEMMHVFFEARPLFDVLQLKLGDLSGR